MISEIDNQIILEFDWTKAFWAKTYELEFYQIWGLYGKTDHYNFHHFRLLPAKSNDKIL